MSWKNDNTVPIHIAWGIVCGIVALIGTIGLICFFFPYPKDFFEQMQEGVVYPVEEISLSGLSRTPFNNLFCFDMKIKTKEGEWKDISRIVPWLITTDTSSFIKMVQIGKKRHLVLAISADHIEKLREEIKRWREDHFDWPDQSLLFQASR